jgi:hypothetical protein
MIGKRYPTIPAPEPSGNDSDLRHDGHPAPVKLRAASQSRHAPSGDLARFPPSPGQQSAPTPERHRLSEKGSSCCTISSNHTGPEP